MPSARVVRCRVHAGARLFLVALLARCAAASLLAHPPVRSGVFPANSNVTVHMALPPWLLAGEGVLHMPKLAVAPENRAQLEAEYKANCHSWEHSKEDVYFFDTFLKDLPQHGGFYVELGALDGSQYSNSWVLDKVLGWRGLLIEPGPVNFEKVRQNRPNAIAINTAVCSEIQDVHFIATPERPDMGGIVEFMGPEFMKAAHPYFDKSDVAKVNALPRITCLPLQLIFDFFYITRIDLLSLDVEGAEYEVIKTLDLTRTHIKYVVVEATGLNAVKDAQVKEYIMATGLYTFHGHLAHNDWFVRID